MIGLSAPTFAQTPPPSAPANPPPARSTVDANGVDLADGDFNFSFGQLSTGGEAGDALSYVMEWYGTEQRDNSLGWIQQMGSTFSVSFGSVAETFTQSGSTFGSDQGTGSTLTFSSGTQTYTYVRTDGVTYVFDANYNSDYPEAGIVARLKTVSEPTGLVTTFHNINEIIQIPYDDGERFTEIRFNRVQSITNNLGYQLHLDYAADGVDSLTDEAFAAFNRVVGVIAINNAVEYCNPMANDCVNITPDYWPEVTFAFGGPPAAQTIAATDSLNRTTTVTLNSLLQIDTITRPETGDEPVDIDYDSNGRVSSVDSGAGTWAYAYDIVSNILTTTVTPPTGTGGTTVAVFGSPNTSEQPSAVTNGTGDTMTYAYDTSGRVTQVTAPEGNRVEYTYDSNGNVTETRRVAKTGSSDPDIVTSATYPCTSAITCNRPSTTTDALGNVTDYAWSGTHGGVTQITRDAPTTGADQPQTRYTYSQHQARRLDASGNVVNTPGQVYRLDSVESCATGSGTSCAGMANETQTVFDYGSGGTAITNLRIETVTTEAGNGTVSATTGYDYDGFGNVISVDGPLSGTDDTTYYFYNDGIQLRGTIGIDPDDAGTQERLAQRMIYDDNGNVTSTVTGSTTGTDLTALTGFTASQTSLFDYDDIGRRVTARLRGDDNVTVSRTDYSYDNSNRPLCTAIRMNPATLDTLTDPACTLSTAGSMGPDRITRRYYDDASRVTLVRSGTNTTDEVDTQRFSYTDNGQVNWMRDANANLTRYYYDGFDRLVEMRYPDATNGSVASTTDLEQYTYDAASNLTARRLRDSTTLNFTYDNLNRRTFMDVPGTAPDVTYGYDNFNRLTSASQTGHTLTFTYDALGRQLTETGPLGTVTSAWGIDGVRDRLTHPDGTYFYMTYWDNGAFGSLRVNATTGTANRLGFFQYDALNRPILWFGGSNGSDRTRQDYAYDPASRLDEISHNLTGSTDDLDLGFTFSPAGQILERTRDNMAYVFDDQQVGTTSYAVDGLNRYDNVDLPGTDTATTAYDARGNLRLYNPTGPLLSRWTYDRLNRLINSEITDAGGTTVEADYNYDPLGRLYEVAVVGGDARRYLWDGGRIIAEYDASGNVTERYAYRPGSLGAPAVIFSGAGTALGDRHIVQTDERGSVLSIADANGGTMESINSYGPYGEPGDSNAGAFGYTGQLWLPEAGLWYMRNRVYDPTLGRFMQTDPIGYEGGMNLYGYVGGDPVNGVDPLGLDIMTTVFGRILNWNTSPTGVEGNPVIVVTAAREDEEPADVVGPPIQQRNPNESQGCEYRDRSGSCVYVRNSDGELEYTEEYQARVCQNYSDLMRSQRQLGHVGSAAVVPGVANAGTGGGVRSISALARILSAPGIVFLGGMTRIVTGVLGTAPPPEGC